MRDRYLRRVLVLSLPPLAVFAGLAVVLRAAPEMPAQALLDAYDRGNYATVAGNLPARHDTLAAFARDLEDTSVTWLSTTPRPEQPRRRLIAAALALEAARAFAIHPDPEKMTERQWADRVRLLEWGARLLGETDVPPPAERAWQLAAVALVEQGYGYPFYAFKGAWDDGRKTIARAAARFPDEPRFALAAAVLAEEDAGLVGYALDSLPNAPLETPRYDVRVQETATGAIDLVLAPRRLPAAPVVPPGRRAGMAGRRGAAPSAKAPVFPTDRLDFRVPLRDAVRGYAALLTRDGVGPEAHLRLGALEIALDQPDVAYPHLARALPGVTDPLAQYAAEFYCGAALTRLGQVQEAEVAFRAALGVRPHAESATVALAWLLMLNEHRDEASALVADDLAATTARPGSGLGAALDPIATFALGDARFWDEDIRDLRAAIGIR